MTRLKRRFDFLFEDHILAALSRIIPGDGVQTIQNGRDFKTSLSPYSDVVSNDCCFGINVMTYMFDDKPIWTAALWKSSLATNSQ
jgi:hypothetical protein